MVIVFLLVIMNENNDIFLKLAVRWISEKVVYNIWEANKIFIEQMSLYSYTLMIYEKQQTHLIVLWYHFA